ncbi:hypothetical protein D3C81_2245920 [compost metagenome]
MATRRAVKSLKNAGDSVLPKTGRIHVQTARVALGGGSAGGSEAQCGGMMAVRISKGITSPAHLMLIGIDP